MSSAEQPSADDTGQNEPSPPAAETQTPAPPDSDGDGASAPVVAEAGEASAEQSTTPRKRKRRRRRGRGKGRREGEAETAAAEPATTQQEPPGGSAQAPAAPPIPEPSLASLAGGLLSHLDDREVHCTVDGCDSTWTWTAAEQIQAYGQAPPKRKCADCSAISDRDVPCVLDGCKRTWVWPASAQLKHRSWARRQGPRDANKRRRRNDGPPRRKCDLCHTKLSQLVERDSVCKVHGCTRTVKVDKDSQLRAWAAMRTDNLDAEPALPKKMCEVCREFCRAHPDRNVDCGRPGCDRTWTYKTGAQLQAFLAGRFEDPIKLACEGNDCDLIRAEAAQLAQSGANDQLRIEGDGEIMPCIVTACDGTWFWHAGTKVAPCNDGDTPIDRMCANHRAEREQPTEANVVHPSTAGHESPADSPEDGGDAVAQTQAES